ncbi:ribosome biosynthesis protein rrb1, partial [Ascosphaera acerosa]
MDRPGEESDAESDSDDDAGEGATEPILESKSIPLPAVANRTRVHQIPPASSASSTPTTLAATWLENGHVAIHDVTPQLAAFDTPGYLIPAAAGKPVSTLRMHKAEGFALDWSALHAAGRLLTGDNAGAIYATTRTEAGAWVTDTARP